MPFLLNARNLALASALLIVLVGTALASPPVPVSGYEIFLGYNCTIKGEAATCGATFSGWTGETSSGGWLAFPGTEQGTWSIRANYTGQPEFGGSVTLVGGSWRFLFISEAFPSWQGRERHGHMACGSEYRSWLRRWCCGRYGQPISDRWWECNCNWLPARSSEGKRDSAQSMGYV